MTFEEAKTLLSTCERQELRDHAFGDREVYWVKDGKEVAFAYFGSHIDFVSIHGPPDGCGLNTNLASFNGKEAAELVKCGSSVRIERNDSTGPDQYAEGQCMPALTLEGVRRELCGDDE